MGVGWGMGVATGTGTLNSDLPLAVDDCRSRLISDSAISFSYVPAANRSNTMTGDAYMVVQSFISSVPTKFPQ